MFRNAKEGTDSRDVLGMNLQCSIGYGELEVEGENPGNAFRICGLGKYK